MNLLAAWQMIAGHLEQLHIRKSFINKKSFKAGLENSCLQYPNWELISQKGSLITEDSAITLGSTSQPALSALSDSVMRYCRVFIRWSFKECGEGFSNLFRLPGKRESKSGETWSLSSRFVHGKYFIITLRQNFPDFNSITPGEKGSVHSCVWGQSGGILGPKQFLFCLSLEVKSCFYVFKVCLESGKPMCFTIHGCNGGIFAWKLAIVSKSSAEVAPWYLLWYKFSGEIELQLWWLTNMHLENHTPKIEHDLKQWIKMDIMGIKSNLVVSLHQNS